MKTSRNALSSGSVQATNYLHAESAANDQRDSKGFLRAAYQDLGGIIEIAYHTRARNTQLIERVLGEGQLGVEDKSLAPTPEPNCPSINDVADRIHAVRVLVETLSAQNLRLQEVL